MRILVIGKTGQLAKSLLCSLRAVKSKHNFVFVSRVQIDLINVKSIYAYLDSEAFDVVVNCAAYTAVDNAELEPDIAYAVNCHAVDALSEICSRKKIKFIHISTDYVFDGNSDEPYKEEDKPSPINIYGNSKLYGEKKILRNMPKDAIIIRTSWLYSIYGNNFVNSIINAANSNRKMDVISDQIGAPTFASDLSELILIIINAYNERFSWGGSQIYHFSNNGKCSWFDFASEIVSISNIDCDINPISSNQYKKMKAKRPKNSVLSKEKVQSRFDIKIPNWDESLKKCISTLSNTQL
jgi:dTDP-4-dehydrorhamnose reductase